MHPRLRELADAPVQGVRLWIAHLAALSTAEVEDLSADLDVAERTRGAQFHFARDQQHYVATRGLLRCLLGTLLDEPAATIVFTYGAHGKPALATRVGRCSIHFNLSHSAGWAMFAVARDRAVGIDLESATRLDQSDEDLSRLAARVLSARELEIWRVLPHSAIRRAAFLRAWTRKEAYAKATGQGIFDALKNTEVILDAVAPKASMTIRSPASGSRLTSDWLLRDLLAPEGFAAALAVACRSDEDIARDEGNVFASLRHA